MIDIYCDGASDQVCAGSGAAIYEDGQLVESLFRGLTGTNNVAEWDAFLLGLEYCVENGLREVCFFTDSKLVVEQFNGRWKMKAAHLRPFLEKARALSKNLSLSLAWIPREQNNVADALSKKGYRLSAKKEFVEFWLTNQLSASARDRGSKKTKTIKKSHSFKQPSLFTCPSLPLVAQVISRPEITSQEIKKDSIQVSKKIVIRKRGNVVTRIEKTEQQINANDNATLIK